MLEHGAATEVTYSQASGSIRNLFQGSSIIEDESQNFSRDLQMLSAGIMNDWEARMRWFNEDEATAKAALPKMQDMGLEDEDEVE